MHAALCLLLMENGKPVNSGFSGCDRYYLETVNNNRAGEMINGF